MSHGDKAQTAGGVLQHGTRIFLCKLVHTVPQRAPLARESMNQTPKRWRERAPRAARVRTEGAQARARAAGGAPMAARYGRVVF